MAVRDFAFDPDVLVFPLDLLADAGDEVADGPDAALGGGGRECPHDSLALRRAQGSAIMGHPCGGSGAASRFGGGGVRRGRGLGGLAPGAGGWARGRFAGVGRWRGKEQTHLGIAGGGFGRAGFSGVGLSWLGWARLSRGLGLQPEVGQRLRAGMFVALGHIARVYGIFRGGVMLGAAV